MAELLRGARQVMTSRKLPKERLPWRSAWASEFQPHVVLLDIGLPGHGRVRGRDPSARGRGDARVVPDRAHRLRPARGSRAGAPAGFDHHLTKPADPYALLALVDAWVDAAATPSASPGRVAETAFGDGVK